MKDFIILYFIKSFPSPAAAWLRAKSTLKSLSQIKCNKASLFLRQSPFSLAKKWQHGCYFGFVSFLTWKSLIFYRKKYKSAQSVPRKRNFIFSILFLIWLCRFWTYAKRERLRFVLFSMHQFKTTCRPTYLCKQLQYKCTHLADVNVFA